MRMSLSLRLSPIVTGFESVDLEIADSPSGRMSMVGVWKGGKIPRTAARTSRSSRVDGAITTRGISVSPIPRTRLSIEG